METEDSPPLAPASLTNPGKAETPGHSLDQENAPAPTPPKRRHFRVVAAIENFGSMDVLCSDKTGTLTEGEVKLHSAVGLDGKPSDDLLLHAFLNAHFQSGYTNPIDAAIQAHRSFDVSEYRKLDEEPYDFVRKRLSVLVACPGKSPILVTKGALDNVLEVCGSAVDESGATVPLSFARGTIERRFGEFSSQGLRTLGVAIREMDAVATGLTLLENLVIGGAHLVPKIPRNVFDVTYRIVPADDA